MFLYSNTVGASLTEVFATVGGRKGGCLVTGVYEYEKERRRRKKKGTEIVYDVQQKKNPASVWDYGE